MDQNLITILYVFIGLLILAVCIYSSNLGVPAQVAMLQSEGKKANRWSVLFASTLTNVVLILTTLYAMSQVAPFLQKFGINYFFVIFIISVVFGFLCDFLMYCLFAWLGLLSFKPVRVMWGNLFKKRT